MTRFSLRREVTLGLLVYGVYLLVARIVLGTGGRARARANADRIHALEERLGIHVEPALQRRLLRYPRLVQGLNVGYGLFNVSLTVGWLIFLYRRRDSGYHALRRACVLGHLGAQPAFLLFATAPPRVSEGFVDTLSELSGIDLEHPRLVRLYNPVAAMPSLHVTFAVITARGIAGRVSSRAGRMLAFCYPPTVALVVAGTGNHYVLDAVAGAALGTAARRLTA